MTIYSAVSAERDILGQMILASTPSVGLGANTTWNVASGIVTGSASLSCTASLSANGTCTKPDSASLSCHCTLSATLTFLPKARLSQAVLEVARTQSPKARLSQAVLEVLYVTPVIVPVDVTRSTTWNVLAHIDVTRSTTWNANNLPLPTHISMWLMANKGTTVDDLNDVSNWTDRTPNHNDVAQSSTFARPALVANQLNGLPILRFNGTTDFLLGNTFLITDAWTIFALVSDNRTDSISRQIISNVASDSLFSAVYLGTIALTGTPSTSVQMTDDVGGPLDPNGHTNGVGEIDNPSNYFILVGEATFNPFIYNGDRLIYGDPGHSIDTRDFSNPYYIGRRGSFSTNYWHGDLAEIIIYRDRALNDSDRQLVINYLKLKWFGTTPVDVTRITTWNVAAATTVDKTRSTTWNVLHLPDAIASTTWNVFINPPLTVDKGPQSTTWNDKSHVDKGPISTTWNVATGLVDVTRSTTWNVAAALIVDKGPTSTSWVVRELASTLLTSTTWNVARIRKKTRSTFWNDEVSVSKTTSTTWNVQVLVSKTTSTTWNVHKLVTLIAFPRPIERTRWNVDENSPTLDLTIVNLQQYAEWDDHHTAGKTVLAIWNDQANASKTESTIWNVDIAVDKGPQSTTWNVRHLVDVQRNTLWLTFPELFLRTAFWNVRVTVSTQRETSWVVISYNNNTSNTTWNDHFLVNSTRNTTWNVLPPPINISRSTTWNVFVGVSAKRLTTWNVLRNRPKVRSTYWNVLSTIISCPLSGSNTANLRIHARWNVLQNSAKVSVSTLWNVFSIVNASGGGGLGFGGIGSGGISANWIVYQRVDQTGVAIWRATLFTSDMTRTTSWADHNAAIVQRNANFNVHIVQVGSSQRSTTWNVHPQVRISAKWNDHTITAKSTTWNVRLKVGITSASTTWNVHAQTRVSTTWNVHQVANKMENTLWNTKKLAGVQRQAIFNVKVDANRTRNTTWEVLELSGPLGAATSWKVLHVVAKIGVASWDTSTVSISIGTQWNNKQIISPNPDGTGTLWDVHPVCSAEFVQANPRLIRSTLGVALLPRITVCELAKDLPRKGYKSKFVK